MNRIVMKARPTSAALFILGVAACSLGGLWSAFNNNILEGARSDPTELRSFERSANRMPSVEPVRYLPITETQATALNLSQEPLDDVGPAALPFRATLDPDSSARALQCLTEAIYYEAGSQDVSGQRAVAQVVLNRVRNAAFPSSICGVVYQGTERATGCQFTFTCDGSLSRGMSEPGLRRARTVAAAALKGHVFAPVGYATHYHADWVVPYWASSLTRATRIGAHIFYRWKGFWGQPEGFSQRYAGVEPARFLPAVNLAVAPKSRGTDPEIDQTTPNIALNRTVLIEDLRTQNLGKPQDALGRQALRADELRGVLLPALQRRPRILADVEQSSTTASNSLGSLSGSAALGKN